MRRCCSPLTSVSCSALLLLAGSTAVAQPFVGWQQITERIPATPGAPVGGSLNQDIAVSADGTKIAFVAAFDYTGENTNGSQEIFIYNTVTDTMTQLTSREGALGGTALFNPQFTPDGNKIIFRAGWDFPTDPPSGNNTSIQVWEVDVNTRQYRRITNFMPNIVNEVRLSADGSKVTFYSTANPVGTNAAGRNEAFIIDRQTLAIQQLTTHVGGFPNAPRPNADGSVVVFDSPGNFDGTNTNGSNELWKVNTSTGVITSISNNSTTAAVAFQVSGAASKSTAFDATGRWVSSAGAWNPFGTNSASNLFLYDLSTTPATISQITTGTGNMLGPIISPNGRYLAIESSRTTIGAASNPDANRELFIYDLQANRWVNSTNSTGGVSVSAISSAATVNFAMFSYDGKWIAYRNDISIEQGVVNNGGNFELFFGYVSDTAAPQIGRSPIPNQVRNTGESVKLRVYAAGRGTLSYAWYRDGVLLSNGASAGGGEITGATTPRLTIQTLGEADAGTYTCVVTNADGTVTSSPAIVTVNPVTTRCSPADIAYGDGEPLPPIGQPGGFNPGGPDGGDFDCFFNFYFAQAPDNAICDIAYGDGEPLPPFGVAGGFNPGVDGGDFDCFFNYYFSGCL